MGQYFLVVNTTKRQYLDAARFGENNKRSGILLGKHGAAVALLLLDASKRPDSHDLAGSWVGDPVVVTGDYAEPNSAGLQTSNESNPSRNLYRLAREEFEDISLEAMLMLIADEEDWAAQFARDTHYSESLLIGLGQLVFNHHCEPLRQALEKTLGEDWPRRYREACDKSGRRYRVKGNKSKYRIVVANLTGVANLPSELKKVDVGATIEVFATGAKASESQAIWLGTNVPAELAVKAIQLAVKHWPFLTYVRLTSDMEDLPAFLHDEICFGSSSRKKPVTRLQQWTENDFNALSPSMSMFQLHEYVRSRY